MDKQVEAAVECLTLLVEDARHVLVRAHVTLGDERARDGARELTDAFLDPLALVGERELRAAFGEASRDRPGDRALVGHTENQSALAFVACGHCTSINRFRLG